MEQVDRYTYQELADMHLIYGVADGNGRAAARLYAQRFPHRRHPSRTTFSAIHRRLRETGTMRPVLADTGRQRYARTPQTEERILEEIGVNPQRSTRSVARDVGVAHSTVWSVLHDQLLYPYRFQKVQHLLPQDYPRRSTFCQWFLDQTANTPDFSSNILFTDEATFTRYGIFNSHNMHTWADENPHVTWRGSYQHRFSLNVWCGIIGDHVIGPHVMPARLTGAQYHEFLEQQLPTMLEDVPLAQRRRMWFMQDGAPSHTSIVARQYLNTQFPNRWIGQYGPTAWPARSPDLNPLDFYLWGHVKSKVYATPVDTEDELLPRIQAACQQIHDTPQVFERVRQSLIRRCRLCVENGGQHVEHLLL